jgi:DNA-binding response OmpR family regulator
MERPTISRGGGAAATAAAAAGAAPAPRARVLIVDDEPSICRALTLALQRAGYEALSTTSGESAQRLLSSEHVDVLLLDLRMPDLRGDVVFHLAVSLQPHLRQQTLFCTGDVSESAQRLIGACGTTMLRKPFDLGDVLEAVQALLPRVRSRTA